MSTENEVITSRFDSHRKYEEKISWKNSLNADILSPNNSTHVVIPQQFLQKIDFEHDEMQIKDGIWTLITAYTGYILSPLDSISFDLTCKPDIVPEWKEKLYTDYTKTCNAVLKGIYSEINLRLVRSIQLKQDGKLSLFLTSGSKKEVDLIGLWNKSIPWAIVKDIQKTPLYLPQSEHLSEIRRMQGRVKAEIRQSQEQIKENIDSDVFMWWAVQFVYVALPVAALGWLATDMWLHSLKTLKKIVFTDQNGVKRVIDEIKHPIQGTKDWMRKNFLQTLEMFDLQYDPVKKGFYNPSVYTLEKVQDMMKMMSYERYQKLAGKDAVSEIEWNRIKQKLTEADITDFYKSLTRGQNIWERVKTFLKANVLEIVFYPLAFEHFRRHQSDNNLIRWAVNWWAAIAGIKLAKHIPGSSVTKFVAGAVIGLWLMMVSESQLKDSVKKWQYFFAEDAGGYTWYKKWKVATGLSSLWINEAWDTLNKYTGNWDNPGDIGIPRIDLIRFPWMPILQWSISIGTDPWEWIRDSATRDTDSWNEKIPKYSENLVKNTLDLIHDFHAWKPPFSKWDGIEKFKERYNSLIFVWSGKYLEHSRNFILGVIAAELESWSGWRSESIIIDAIKSRCSDMYISKDSLDNKKNKLEEKKKSIEWYKNILLSSLKEIKEQSFATQYASNDSQINQNKQGEWFKERLLKAHPNQLLNKMTGEVNPVTLEKPISVESQKSYIQSIFDRMLSWKEIVTPSRWEKTEVLGLSSKKLILSEEVIIFQTLLSNNTLIQFEWKSIKVSELFALMLDDMAEYSEQYNFLTRVKSGNKKWYDWK